MTFITLEGPEGSGKTTQATSLADRLRSDGHRVVLVHEPGGTHLGEAVRRLLLDRTGPPVSPWTEALLFGACRAQLVDEIIRPALAEGTLVIADRFSDSTLAYQGGGRGLPLTDLQGLVRLAEKDVHPDLTLLLDVPVEAGLARRQWAESDRWTRFEAEELPFHQRVREAYLELARAQPERWAILQAAGTIDEVAAAIWRAVQTRLPT